MVLYQVVYAVDANPPTLAEIVHGLGQGVMPCPQVGADDNVVAVTKTTSARSLSLCGGESRSFFLTSVNRLREEGAKVREKPSNLVPLHCVRVEFKDGGLVPPDIVNLVKVNFQDTRRLTVFDPLMLVWW